MQRQYTYSVPMECISCAASIHSIFKDQSSFSVDVDYLTRRVIIAVDESDRRSDAEIKHSLLQLFEAGGFEPTEINEVKTHFIKSALGLSAGFVMLFLSLAGVALVPMCAMVSASVLLTLYLGKETYQRALQNVRERKMTMNTLFAVSTMVAMAVTIASHVISGLPMICDVGLLIFGFQHLGKAIEKYAERKVISGFTFREKVADEITVKGKVSKVKLEDVRVDDVVMIRHRGNSKHRVIACDGILMTDDAWLETDILDGRTTPRRFKKGDMIFAGTRLSAHHRRDIEIRVTHSYESSHLAALDKKAEHIKREKAPYETQAEKIIGYFVSAVFALSLISGVVIAAFFPLSLAIQSAITILVSACPCTLQLIPSLSVHIGIAKAANEGAVFKDGKSVQAAESIDTVVFDITGTLNTGKQKVLGMTQHDHGMTEEAILRIVYALEKNSTHPVGQAIGKYVDSLFQKKGWQLPTDKMTVAQGRQSVTAIVNGDHYEIGQLKQYMATKEQGLNQEVGISKNGVLIASLTVASTLRPDAKNIISTLLARKVNVHLCTGMNEAVATAYASYLGVPLKNVAPNQKEKADYIKLLQAQGSKVAMVGDAGNDRNAMLQSDVSMAMPSIVASDVARNEASVKLTRESLKPVLAALIAAKQTVNNIKLSMAMNVVYNVFALLLPSLLAITWGVAFPAVGPVAMIVMTGMVFLMAYRFKVQPLLPASTQSPLASTGLAASAMSEQPVNRPTHRSHPRNVNRSSVIGLSIFSGESSHASVSITRQDVPTQRKRHVRLLIPGT